MATPEQPIDYPTLALHHGGDWCDCIEKVIEQLTPKKLAVYCIEQKYKEQHKPIEDDLGVRYGYFLTSEKRTIQRDDGEEEEKTVNIVAAFGDFNFRSMDTLNSVIRAVKEIAWYECRTPQMVCEDVVKCDESKAPAAAPQKAEIQESAYVPQTRRYRQSSDGTLRPI